MKPHNTIEIKYKEAINSIDYSKFSNFNSFITIIASLFKIQIKSEETLSLFYIEKDHDFDKISISSIEDIEQIALFHYKNYKDTLQFEIHIISAAASKDSSHMTEEDHSNYGNQLLLSSNNLDLDEILESKETKIVNSKLNELQASSFKSKTMTINNISKNFIDESFEFDPALFNNNQQLPICHCKTSTTPIQLEDSNIHLTNPIEVKQIPSPKEGKELFLSLNLNACSNCKKGINDFKHICIMCTKYQLCSDCYSAHSRFHPMLVVANTQHNICSLEELASFLKREKIKKGSKGLLSNLYSVFSSPQIYKLKIAPFSAKINSFAIGQREMKGFPIVIENLTKLPIEKDLVFQIKNARSLSVFAEPIRGMKSEGVEIADLMITAGVNKEESSLTITLQARDIQINCNTIQFMIRVVDKDCVIEENINLFFKDKVKIQQMSKNDKVKLYNIIVKDSTNKDVNEINHLLQKHNYDMKSTLEELSWQIEENAEESDV